MAEVVGEIGKFLKDKNASAIAMVPLPGPSQRGPTCGFYALSFVMNYWHQRSNTFGGDYAAKTEPLPARTNVKGPPLKDPSSEEETRRKEQRRKDVAEQGKFASLRQYGKFKNLTSFGSVFNADDLLAVAKGEGAQYGGHYDGKVVRVAGSDEFVDMVRRAINLEVPVIVPYDAEGRADASPGNASGEKAHWVVIFGILTDSNVEYAVYFTWGKFCYAPLADFAVSNAQLTSNKYVPLVKVQIELDKGRPMIRDYLQVKQVKEVEPIKAKAGIMSIKTLSPEVHNPEFNEAGKGLLDDMDGRSRIQVGGLRSRIVVIFRAEDREFLAGQMSFLA